MPAYLTLQEHERLADSIRSEDLSLRARRSFALLCMTLNPRPSSLPVDFGFTVGHTLGTWVTRGISPGYISRAATIATATLRRDFPWRKVPVYTFSQVMGGLCGAGIVYANCIYFLVERASGCHVRTIPGTAGLFAT